ncbi:MAG TPA: response regulator [Candidatus Omnitrophica bacterium]|nr:response regulator [Candidatus Omnitrophota bacterium]
MRVAKNYRILVVNDELEILKVIEEFLSRQGFSVWIALGSEKALEVLTSGSNIDLIIVDLKMPKMGGIKLIEEIRRLRKDIPIIVLTGSIYIEKYREELNRLNCKEVLLKPIDLNLLLEKIRKRLS